MPLQRAELYRCAVSRRTEWLLLRLTDADGVAGWGECSDAGPLGAVLRRLDGWGRLPSAGDEFTHGTLLGAMRQAQADQAARRAGQPLWQWLGGPSAGAGDSSPAVRPADSSPAVELYAALDRSVRGRAPAEVAATAEAAVLAGFRTVQLAPFAAVGGDRLAHLGLARVRAVRGAVGDGSELLVDCARRLPPAELLGLLEAFAKLRVGWLEDGVGLDRPAEWAALRSRTGIPLAGGRLTTGVGQLASVAGLLDVVRLDVRQAGGPAAVLAMAAAAGSARVSLHNPAGPVATLHSAHLAVRLPAEPLEYAFGEVPWRGELLGGAERISGGRLVLPTGPGLGAEPDLRHRSVTPLWRGTVVLGDWAQEKS